MEDRLFHRGVAEPALEGRRAEFVDHLHEHFVHPVVIRDARYTAPLAPGYSIEMKPESLRRYEFPVGEAWAGRGAGRSWQ